MTVRKALAIPVIGAAFLALAVLPTPSAAQARVIVRPRAYYSYGYYPYVYPYRYGFYGPRWYYPGYPGRYLVVPAGPTTGEVKIKTHMKSGSVYVDGGFAGPTDKMKKFNLRPGNHDIEVRDPSGY